MSLMTFAHVRCPSRLSLSRQQRKKQTFFSRAVVSFAGAQRDVDGSDGSDVCRGRSVHTFHVANGASDARAAGAWHAGAASGAYPKRRREMNFCFGSFQKMAKLHFWDFEFPSLRSLHLPFNLITTVCGWLVEHVSLSHHRPSACVLPGATNPPDETVYQWEPQSGARTHCHLFQRT